MIRNACYLCHNCGDPLAALVGSKMFYCARCKAKRRTPNHPALMASWRWEEIQAERQDVP